MSKLKFLKTLLLMLCISPITLFSQSKNEAGKKENVKQHASQPTEEKKFEPINLWFVMLTKGAKRDQDSISAMKLQEGHMANINKMAEEKKLLVAGPFLEDANWRGIFILKCETREEAEQLIQRDPAIAAGRLAYEIHPWMTGKNCLFK